MFGIFKKKTANTSPIDARTQQLLASAAEILKVDLLLCKAQAEKYNNFLNSMFVRGYIVGFFDCARQSANINVTSDAHFISLISIGTSYLFEGDIKKAGLYTVDSLVFQGDQEFDDGQMQGGEMYFNFMNGCIHVPNGLSSRFHSLSRSDV